MHISYDLPQWARHCWVSHRFWFKNQLIANSKMTTETEASKVVRRCVMFSFLFAVSSISTFSSLPMANNELNVTARFSFKLSVSYQNCNTLKIKYVDYASHDHAFQIELIPFKNQLCISFRASIIAMQSVRFLFSPIVLLWSSLHFSLSFRLAVDIALEQCI